MSFYDSKKQKHFDTFEQNIKISTTSAVTLPFKISPLEPLHYFLVNSPFIMLRILNEIVEACFTREKNVIVTLNKATQDALKKVQ